MTPPEEKLANLGPADLTPDDIERLVWLRKEIPKADAAVRKWTDRAGRDSTPRRGLRGGRNTTINAKWGTAKEYRDRLWDELWALEERGSA